MFEPTESLTRGQRALQACRFDEAQQAFSRALQFEPQSIDALRGLGYSLFQLRRLSGSLEAVERALSIDSSDLLSRLLMGRLCLRLQQPVLAQTHFEAILERIPDSESATSGLIDVQVALGQLAPARARCEKILHSHPASEVGQLAAARLAMFERDDARALQHFESLIRSRPGQASHVYNRGLCLLRLGRLERGWRDYESRFDAGAVSLRRVQTPRWDGRAVERLLILAEQGLGDTLLFSRFLADAARSARHLILACAPSLTTLLGRSFGIECVADDAAELPAHDAHLPLMSLPQLLDLPDAAQSRPAYLSVDPARRQAWSTAWASEPAARLRVGLVHATSVAHSTEENPFTRRSCRPEDLRSLTELPGVLAYNLGLGPVGKEARSALPALRSLPGELRDFDDTAAAIEHLDAVVSVDTALVHLAGAMGKPALLLLPHACDWRWQPGRAISPWYSSVQRLIGDSTPGWTGGVEQARRELQARLAAAA